MRIYSMNKFYLILLKISLNSANEYRIHEQKLDTDELHIFFTHFFYSRDKSYLLLFYPYLKFKRQLLITFYLLTSKKLEGTQDTLKSHKSVLNCLSFGRKNANDSAVSKK